MKLSAIKKEIKNYIKKDPDDAIVHMDRKDHFGVTFLSFRVVHLFYSENRVYREVIDSIEIREEDLIFYYGEKSERIGYDFMEDIEFKDRSDYIAKD
jgi:hypothetical protein